MNSMKDFNFELFKDGMYIIAQELSDHEMEPYVRQKIKDCLASNPTPRQLYDMMAKVAALPCKRIMLAGQKVSVGHISGFIQAYCDVTKHYNRPEE